MHSRPVACWCMRRFTSTFSSPPSTQPDPLQLHRAFLTPCAAPGPCQISSHPLSSPLASPNSSGCLHSNLSQKEASQPYRLEPKIHENWTLHCLFSRWVYFMHLPKFCFQGALAWCISPIAWGPLRLLSSLGQQAGPGQAGTSIIRASYGASSGLHMVAHIALDMAIYMGRYMANDLQLLWAPDSLGQNFCYRILSWWMVFCC